MKPQKLLIIAAIVCLLVGASGAAMARNDCPDGSLAGGTLDEIVIDEFVSCSVVGVVVTGRVLIKDADQFTMKGSLVEGNFRVINVVSANLVDNQVVNGNLVAKGNGVSFVAKNIVTGGTIRVNDDTCDQEQDVAVLLNLVFNGNLRVNCNDKADVKENKVTNGDITCSDNDNLDSIDNDAFGGRVSCSKSLFQ